jgi:16S rRNA (uracil1498-N3)-methyltransferase
MLSPLHQRILPFFRPSCENPGFVGQLMSHDLRMLRVPISPLHVGSIQLDKTTSHYLVDVHRARAGTEFVAFDAEAALQARACVVVANSRAAICRVDNVETATAVPSHRLALVQAISKGARVDQVVRDATALDVTEIWVAATQHSAAPNAMEMSGRLERWRKIAVESARQCERGNIPRIHGLISFENALQQLSTITGPRLVLSPNASAALWEGSDSASYDSAALVIGPEGGLSEQECSLARELGFREVRLGQRVLKTEVAAVVALSVMMAMRGR